MNKVDIAKLKNIYSALANENRLKIILLTTEKQLTVTELSKTLNLNYTITSEYIGILAKNGLVSRSRQKNRTVKIKSLIQVSNNGEFVIFPKNIHQLI